MKKGLVMLIAAMILLIAFSGVTLATDVMIGHSFTVEGAGVINSDLTVATEQWNSGLKLNERLYTISGGFNGNGYTHIIYDSEFTLDMYNATDNITDNSTTVLEYSSTAKMSNAKRAVFMKNYAVGAVMGFKNEGFSSQEVSMYSEDTIMEVDISGRNVGDITLFEKVVDVSNTHNIVIRDISELKGEFNYNWSAYVEKIDYPAAEGVGDWLGCP